MRSNRLSFDDERTVQSPPVSGGFMAVPTALLGVMDAGAFQRQLYQWAFEQAKQAVEASRPGPMRELFAIMN
jgi:hypothetical protein